MVGPIPDQIFDITKKQFQLVKSLHHIRALRTSSPKTWVNWISNINDNMRLAFADAKTKRQISSVTSNCLSSLQNLALDHYEKTLNGAWDFLLIHYHRMDDNSFNLSIEHIYKCHLLNGAQPS